MSENTVGSRESISAQFGIRLKDLSDLANKIAECTQEKLSRVQIPQVPSPLIDKNKCDVIKEEDIWPPMFSDYRDNLKQIRRALDKIDSSVTKSEI